MEAPAQEQPDAREHEADAADSWDRHRRHELVQSGAHEHADRAGRHERARGSDEDDPTGARALGAARDRHRRERGLVAELGEEDDAERREERANQLLVHEAT
jgi:hypothetical protein